MQAYMRCGSAISEKACADAGTSCVWSDELERSGTPTRRLHQVIAAAPSTVPRACMPKQLYVMERNRDRSGIQRSMKQIATQDPAGGWVGWDGWMGWDPHKPPPTNRTHTPLPAHPAWGECPGVSALRSMIKTCAAFSSPGTCKSIGPLCRWNEAARACLTTGAGQITWALGVNASEIADEGKRCAKANDRLACVSQGTVNVDPKLFASVQLGELSAATNAAAGARAAAAGAAAALAAVVAVLML